MQKAGFLMTRLIYVSSLILNFQQFDYIFHVQKFQITSFTELLIPVHYIDFIFQELMALICDLFLMSFVVLAPNKSIGLKYLRLLKS